jgi:hypothetical protein
MKERARLEDRAPACCERFGGTYAQNSSIIIVSTQGRRSVSLLWMNYALSDDGPPDPVDRYVLVGIAHFADRNADTAWPSMASIAEKTRKSESTVRRSIASLESAGYISVVRGRGSGKVSLYTFHRPGKRCQPDTFNKPEKGVNGTPFQRRKKVSKQTKKGVISTEKRCQPDTQTVYTTGNEPGVSGASKSAPLTPPEEPTARACAKVQAAALAAPLGTAPPAPPPTPVNFPTTAPPASATCQVCQDVGLVRVERDGRVFSRPCSCQAKPPAPPGKPPTPVVEIGRQARRV